MRKMSLLKILITIAVGAAAFVVSFLITYHFVKGDNTIDRDLAEAASEINKICPFMVDAETRLDNMLSLPGKVVQYNCTLVNLTKAGINIEKIKETVAPLLLNNIKTNEGLRNFRDKGVIMKYSYGDKNRVFLFSMEFKPEDYRQ
jgi:hypothetical protein